MSTLIQILVTYSILTQTVMSFYIKIVHNSLNEENKELYQESNENI